MGGWGWGWEERRGLGVAKESPFPHSHSHLPQYTPICEHKSIGLKTLNVIRILNPQKKHMLTFHTFLP